MIIIDYNDKRPIYEQIIERFQTLIINGVMETDEKLPSVRTLAVELSINPARSFSLCLRMNSSSLFTKFPLPFTV